MDKWTPAARGHGVRVPGDRCSRSKPFRDRINVVSDLAHAPVAPWTGEDTGGAENHVRAAAVFLSGAHPVKKNEAHVGVTDRPGGRAARRTGHAAAVDRAVDGAART